MSGHISGEDDLPPDNAARIAIYDVLAAAPPEEGTAQSMLTEEELFSRAIGRLRILVPRELHVIGEEAYVQQKISACIDAGLVERVDGTPGLLAVTGVLPRVRYLDGTVRDYDAGLEAARERLEADDANLRRRGVDVHRLVPSLADKPGSEGFRALVDSMLEHGYLKLFPIMRGADGLAVDGRARIAAATIANVDIVTLPQKENIPLRRDTPLHRILLALDVNQGRISAEQRQTILDVVAKHAGRDWPSLASDLALTRGWRLAEPRRYVPVFEVKTYPWRDGEESTIQVTPDGKVMLRSLLEAANVAVYKGETKAELLRDHVPWEKARTSLSGRPATFVRITDAIYGIEAMQRDRRKRGRAHEKAWDDIRDWLIRTFETPDDSRGAGLPTPLAEGSTELAQRPTGPN